MPPTILRAGLLLSLAANVVLVVAAFDFFKKDRALRLDPAELHVYADAPVTSGTGRRVVFFGDSRAGAWPAPEIPGTNFINRGIGGQTSEQVLARFDADLASLNPGVVVLQVGVNDIKELGLFPDRRAAILARCKANLDALVFRSNAIGAGVIVSTVFSIGEVPLWRRFYMDGGDITRGIAEVNTHIRTLASEFVGVLEAGRALDGPDGRLRDEVQHDYLHLNLEGYRALEPELRSMLASIRAPAEVGQLEAPPLDPSPE